MAIRFDWRVSHRGRCVLAMLFLFAAGVMQCPAQGCNGVPPSTNGSVTWNPQWCQEFNSTTAGPPDTTAWAFDLGNGGFGNNEIETYCGPAIYLSHTMQVRASCLLFFLMVVARAPSSDDQATPRANPTPTGGAVQVAMKNVMYHYNEPIAVHIVQLQGELTPTKPGTIVVFDDKESFLLNLSAAEIAISCNSLAQVMNDQVFAAADAPIKKVSIAPRNNQLIIRGQLHQKGDIPFETAGTLSAEHDGRIRFHAENVKAAHLPVKGLLDLLGIDLAKLIDTKKVNGVSIDKDDLILNPSEILPPPHIRGQVTVVRLEGDQIVQIFGSPQKTAAGTRISGNYMAYRDNDLRFGKLTMSQTDMVLIDMDPADPFDFYLDHYRDQLVAGYTKTTPEFGLRVYMRDYSKLHKATGMTRARN